MKNKRHVQDSAEMSFLLYNKENPSNETRTERNEEDTNFNIATRNKERIISRHVISNRTSLSQISNGAHREQSATA